MYRKLDGPKTLADDVPGPAEGEDPCECSCLQPVERGSEAPVAVDRAMEQLGVYYEINGLLPNNTR